MALSRSVTPRVITTLEANQDFCSQDARSTRPTRSIAPYGFRAGQGPVERLVARPWARNGMQRQRSDQTASHSARVAKSG